MPDVLVTVSGGTADYCTAGVPIRVVLIDFDHFASDGVFPEEIEWAIRDVQALGDEIPWRDNTIRILWDLQRKAVERLRRLLEEEEEQ